MKKDYFFKIKISLMLLAITGLSSMAYGQLHPLGSSYFMNQYLNNPAMAGYEQGLSVNLSHRSQWSAVPGTPVSQSLTAEYGSLKKAGFAISLYGDEAGLQKWTQGVATYAYHLPLDNDNELHFGISLGFTQDRLNEENIKGNPNDLSVGRYNQRETYLDGDFGIAYTSGGLSLQGALPNMKSFIKSDLQSNTVDRSTIFLSGSYKFNLDPGNEGLSLEPKVNFRGIKGYHNMLDVGALASLLNNQIQLFGLYHSSKSATYGFGFQYLSLNISGMYTSETSAIQGFANGSFEVSLRLQTFKSKRKEIRGMERFN